MKKIMRCSRLRSILPVLLTVLLAFTACKKEQNLFADGNNTIAEQFLLLPKNASPILQSINNNLRIQLRQQDFSEAFIRMYGRPLWEKAIKKGNDTNRFVLYVPTQLVGQNEVASYFTATYQNGQFTYRLYPKSAVAKGLHGAPNWQMEYWFARLEAKAFGKTNIRLRYLSPTIHANTKARLFGIVNTGLKVGKAAAVTYTDGDWEGADDCCIEIWMNPDGDEGNNNGDEYYLRDDCSACDEGEQEDSFVDGGGNGCPWYNPLCNTLGGSGNSLSQTVSFLSNTLQLNTMQTSWLTQNADLADTLAQLLEESLEDMDPSTGLPYITYPEYAMLASKATLAASMANYINGPFNTTHWNIVNPYLPQTSPSINDPNFWMLMRVNCAILRFEHPDWSTAKIYWEAFSEVIHFSLDGVGMLPFIGEVADLTNGIIYAIEGDGTNATLSFLGMIPFAGWATTGARMAKKTITLANGKKTTLKWIIKADNNIHFGNGGQLRRVLCLAKGDPRVAHHIIPLEVFDHWAIQKAAKGNDAFHLNEFVNGVPLLTIVHYGSHPAYSTRVRAKLTAISPNLGVNETRAEIEQIIASIKDAILQSRPGTNINDIIF